MENRRTITCYEITSFLRKLESRRKLAGPRSNSQLKCSDLLIWYLYICLCLCHRSTAEASPLAGRPLWTDVASSCLSHFASLSLSLSLPLSLNPRHTYQASPPYIGLPASLRTHNIKCADMCLIDLKQASQLSTNFYP